MPQDRFHIKLHDKMSLLVFAVGFYTISWCVFGVKAEVMWNRFHALLLEDSPRTLVSPCERKDTWDEGPLARFTVYCTGWAKPQCSVFIILHHMLQK